MCYLNKYSEIIQIAIYVTLGGLWASQITESRCFMRSVFGTVPKRYVCCTRSALGTA